MEYTLANASYNKRGLTDNIIFKVIADEYGPVKNRAPEYEAAADSLKNAELTSQQDACPVVGREELEHVITTVRTLLPDLRARHTQTGTAVSAPDITEVTDEDALFQIVNGTYINISPAFNESSKEKLLAKGILPLYSEELLPEGTIVFVQDILDTIQSGGRELSAYLVEDKLVPTKLKLAVGMESIPDAVFGRE